MGHTWLRLLAVLLVCLIGATPSGARRLESAPPGVEERTEFPLAGCVEQCDGPGCTAHVVPTGDAALPPPAWFEPIVWSTRIAAAKPAISYAPQERSRGHVLPRGPPASSARV